MSRLILVCENCGTEREVDATLAGTVITCSNCEASIRIPMPDIDEGVEIGGFILEKQLGFGSMGEVWLARQKTMDRKVALKLLSRKFTLDSQFVERFLSEVKISAKMDHPNMVTAFDAGCDDDIYYLAITYVDGLTLEDKLEELGVFDEKSAINVTLDIAKALKYAWDDYQIIHRDIKPANIMIDKKGVGKLMDLGISKSIQEETNLTMTGTIIGTPYYMSPEQGIGDKNLDFHTDIYSLGATLYHLVTGEVPFQATTALGIVSKHITEPFPPPQHKNKHVSDECSALLEIMMGKEPALRQGSWDLVISDMELVLKGEFPASTKRPGPGDSLVMRASGEAVAENGKKNTSGKMVVGGGGEDEPEGNILNKGDDLALHTLKERGRFPTLLVTVIAVLISVIVVFIFMPNRNENNGLLNINSKDLLHKEFVNSIKNTAIKIEEDKKINPVKNSVKKLGQVDKIDKGETVSPDEETYISDTSKVKELDEMWKFAQDFIKKNPDSFDLALGNFMEVSKSATGTKYKMMADVQIAALKKRKVEAVAEVLKNLNAESTIFENKKEYRQAAEVYSNYSGKFADETAVERKKCSLSLLVKAELLDKKRSAERDALEAEKKKYLRSLADAMIAGKWREAKQLTLHPPEQVEVPKEATTVIDELMNVDKRVFSYFRSNIGKTISVNTTSGLQSIKIKRIKGKAIYIEEKKGRVVIQKTFPLSRLTSTEKVKLAGLSADAGAFYLAADAFHRKDMENAMKYLKNIKGFYSVLVADTTRELVAKNTLIRFLKKLNIENDLSDLKSITDELNHRNLTPIQIDKINAGVKLYREHFSSTEFVKKHEPILRILEMGGKDKYDIASSEDHNLKEDVSINITGELRSIPVVKRLLRRINPEYNGEGRFVQIRSQHIILVDLSGVRGIDNRSLKVLKHLSLIELNLANTGITDISQLKDMSLKQLDLRECAIRDLSPLKNMTSLKKLSLFHTDIVSLKPLEGLRLDVLDIAATHINDLEPLKGMPLKALRILDCPIKDFSPLARCKSLEFIDPWETWRMIPGKEYKADQPPKKIPKGLFEPIGQYQGHEDNSRKPDPDLFRN